MAGPQDDREAWIMFLFLMFVLFALVTAVVWFKTMGGG